jgi:NADH dehydrogenase
MPDYLRRPERPLSCRHGNPSAGIALMARARIVIIGGGFGGVYAARLLEKMLTPAEAEICLVNRVNYFVFQPLLPEVVSGSIGLVETVSPIRRLCDRSNLYVQEAERVDLVRRAVTLAPALRPRATELSYDYLIIAAGTITNLSGMPGMAEHALPFRNLGDALRLRNHVIEILEAADNEADQGFRKRLLTFVVGGGGFSGVEVAAELNDFLRSAVRRYRHLSPADIRCILVHSGERILPEMAPDLAQYAQRILSSRGVELKLEARVKAATAGSVHLNTGEVIGARTLVSTVPSGPTPLVASLECQKERGRLVTNAQLELAGHEGRVWAIGDCALIRMADGEFAPPTAQHATREAETAAANIAAALHGLPQQPFAFAGLGKLGSLGHHSAVAEVLGIKVSGFFAWLLWRAIYWSKMPGFERKVRIGLDWFTAALFPADLVQLRTDPSDNITSEHFEAGQSVFEQGDLPDRLYVIRKGEVEVIRDGARIATLGSGESFGEMALLTGRPRNATVRATQPTDCIAVSRGDVAKLLASFPELHTGLSDLAAKRRPPGTAN